MVFTKNYSRPSSKFGIDLVWQKLYSISDLSLRITSLQVVQAVVILAHFHSLSSFIHGCGITPEVDFDNGHTFLLDPASQMGGGGDDGGIMPSNHSNPHPHGQVSFALDYNHEGGSGSTTSGLGAGAVPHSHQPKQTKSILKKTESNGNNSSTSNNANNSPIGINVPNVHFHHNHHLYHNYHHYHHHSSPSSLNHSPTMMPSLLKSDTLHNSLCGGRVGIGMTAGSPPRATGSGNSVKIGGVTSSSVSEVDIIMATMKNLSETSPIEE